MCIHSGLCSHEIYCILVCTCSSAAGVRRGCCRRSPCLALLSLVFAEATAAAVLAHAFLPLVFAEATAAAVLALALLSLVVAEAAAAAVLEHVPAPVVLADTAAVFTLTRL